MKNVVLVVDTRNIMVCLGKTFGQGKLDYQKYIQAALSDDEIMFASIAYGCTSNGNEHRFMSSLKHLGLETKFKSPISKTNSETNETTSRWVNWNVGIAVDVIRLAQSGKVDRVIIGSSDPELVELVEYLKTVNIKVEIFACGIPRILKAAALEFKEITEDLLLVPKTN